MSNDLTREQVFADLAERGVHTARVEFAGGGEGHAESIEFFDAEGNPIEHSIRVYYNRSASRMGTKRLRSPQLSGRAGLMSRLRGNRSSETESSASEFRPTRAQRSRGRRAPACARQSETAGFLGPSSASQQTRREGFAGVSADWISCR